MSAASTTAGWQSTPPTEPGEWEMRCWETGCQPSRLRVYRWTACPACHGSGTVFDFAAQARRDCPACDGTVDGDGELSVECPTLGKYPLDRYHAGLCDVEWRKALP